MWIFEPILKKTIWGGSQLKEIKNLNNLPENDGIGESWELSDVEGHESIIKEGKHKGQTLSFLIEKYGALLLGKANFQRFGLRFPLLIKYIDAAQDLSIQVHPDDEMAQQVHNSLGKTEMWYVLNSQPNSYLYCGFNEPLSIDNYDDLVHNGTIIDKLNKIYTKPGDTIYVPAGRIHAIGAGNLIVEIQETSDITYRVFDYNRKDANGNYRELHTEFARQALNFNDCNVTVEQYDSTIENKLINLVSSPMFSTNIINLSEETEIDTRKLDSFMVAIVLEGGCNITSHENTDDISETHEKQASSGTTILFPATTKKIKFTPLKKSKILVTYIDSATKE